ncbi:MAG: FIST signal transduction protein [Bacteroidota bacterium]
MILTCDANGYSRQEWNGLLTGIVKPVAGGIFPGIIFQGEKYDTGTLILGFDQRFEATVCKEISNPDHDFENELLSFASSGVEMNTVLIFIDGLSRRISHIIESLFLVLGLDHNFIGGGCGSASMTKGPCILSNEGLLEDAAIVSLIPAKIGLGVRHGWESISGPLKVTSSDYNIIRTIDYRPAYEIYSKTINTCCPDEMNPDNFALESKKYPLGIRKWGAEMLVRDPFILTEAGDLTCIGEVPKGSFVEILNGESDSLIRAAAEARELSIMDTEASPEVVFVIDCISRYMFLGKDFDRELESLKYGNIPMIGAMTIGEIANDGKQYPEFFNKTIVVGSFYAS